jgi:hypothetical protein
MRLFLVFAAAASVLVASAVAAQVSVTFARFAEALDTTPTAS